MNTTVFITFWLIVLARITDVSLDTIRTVSIVQGRRAFAAVLGFVEAVVYVCAIAKVLLNLNQPVYALAYGLGFAMGTYLGIVLEQRLAFGKQLVFLVTPKGPDLAKVLRAQDYNVAEIKGHTREGDLTILCVEILRRKSQELGRLVSAVDERCEFLVQDLRLADLARRGAQTPNQRNLSWLSPLGVVRPYFHLESNGRHRGQAPSKGALRTLLHDHYQEAVKNGASVLERRH